MQMQMICRRILVIALAAVLALGTAFSLSGCGASDAYALFAGQVKKEQAEYGPLSEAERYWCRACGGLGYIGLFDFDGDDTDELVLAHYLPDPALRSCFVMEVWRYNGHGGIELVYSGDPYIWGVEGFSIEIVTDSEKLYFISNCDPSGSQISTKRIIGIKNGKAVEVAKVKDANYSRDTHEFEVDGTDYYIYSHLDLNFGATDKPYENSQYAHASRAYKTALVKLGLEAYEPESVTAELARDTGETRVTISDSMFNADSGTYHADLALLAMALSGAAYDSGNSVGSGAFIEKAYRALGFGLYDEHDYDCVSLYSYPESKLNQSDVAGMTDSDLAFSIAHREIGDKTLLVIVMRGSTTAMDWIRDTDTDSEKFLGVRAHKGFRSFYSDVMNALSDYTSRHSSIMEAIRQGTLRVLVTGHSLGAAAANLIGAEIDSLGTINGWSCRDNTYVYCFACPRTYNTLDGDNSTAGTCSNIFNVLIDKDPVPKLPTQITNFREIWKRFGTDMEFKTTYSGITWPTHHEVNNYIAAVTDSTYQ